MSLRILIVDDDDLYWDLIQAIVQRERSLAHVEVARLTDGDELIALLAAGPSSHPDRSSPTQAWPDVVLLDQRMTTMDGVETLLALRERGLGTAMSICLMTSADSPLLITDALRAGARFCFTKPLEFAQLKLHLSEIARFFSEVAVLPRTEAGGRNGDEST